MSSSGGTKDHRQEQPLPEDYNTPEAEMETNHILKSQLTGESRQEKGDTKKRRDEHDKIQDREVVQRSLESGQSDDVIDVEKFGKWTRSSNNGITCPFQTVRKRDKSCLL
jgi:hypothetical protein